MSLMRLITNKATGTNNTAHKITPTIIPVFNPCLELYGDMRFQNNETCPNMLPTIVPVKTCNPNPISGAVTGS